MLTAASLDHAGIHSKVHFFCVRRWHLQVDAVDDFFFPSFMSLYCAVSTGEVMIVDESAGVFFF